MGIEMMGFLPALGFFGDFGVLGFCTKREGAPLVKGGAPY